MADSAGASGAGEFLPQSSIFYPLSSRFSPSSALTSLATWRSPFRLRLAAPHRRPVLVEREDVVEAREEQDAGGEVESERRCDPRHDGPAAGLDAQGQRNGNPLEQEECGLVALHAADGDRKDVLVDGGRDEEARQRGPDPGPAPAARHAGRRLEQVFLKELVDGPVVPPPEVG